MNTRKDLDTAACVLSTQNVVSKLQQVGFLNATLPCKQIRKQEETPVGSHSRQSYVSKKLPFSDQPPTRGLPSTEKALLNLHPVSCSSESPLTPTPLSHLA